MEIYPRHTEQLARELNTQFLGSIPIDRRVADGADSGVPIVVDQIDSNYSLIYKEICEKILKFLSQKQNVQ